jgi:transposase
VIGISEEVTIPAESLAPSQHGSDRQAAHYYRAMHARAVGREEQWKDKARNGEKIIAALVYLMGVLLREIGELKRQLAWLNKQQFGRKSEKSPQRPYSGTTPAGSGAEAGAQSAVAANPGAGEGQSKRRRGNQPGAPGPKRLRRLHLPVQTTHHTLSEAERTCPICGKVRPDLGLIEQSEEIEWKVTLVRHLHIRHRYGRGCQCAPGPSIRTAPRPAKLIPKGLFAVSFWVEVLLKKFEFAQPLQRIAGELAAHELHVSAGTLTSGLQRIGKLIQPLGAQLVLRSRQGEHWQMDETRWPMFCMIEGKGRQQWWFWVVVTPEVTVFLLEPTRSGRVPRDFFPKGTNGILNVDRYPGYFALLGSDWSLKLAYCWSHQRRDFVNLGQGCQRHARWAEQWTGWINELFATNAHRRRAWLGRQAEWFEKWDAEVRRQVQQLKEHLEAELAGGQLAPEPQKVLQSMRRHWQGLTVFVDHPQVPMDNNAAERANRPLAVARKNFYGSGAEWSGELACACFTLLATLRQHQLCPRKYFTAYLEACARQGGRAPDNLDEFLPWKMSPEKRAAWGRQSHPP